MLYKCSTNKAELISKTIVANGIYDASSSNADGFHSVTVNVPKQINVDEIEITENGVYNSSTNELDGYDKVTVAVEPNVDSKDISQNGTYNASDDGLDGYSSITVDVEGGGADLGTKNITENGTYDAGDDNLDGYSSVTVNVSGGGNLGTKTITANGTYNASDDNLYGYSSVTVNVAVPISYVTQAEYDALTLNEKIELGFIIIRDSSSQLSGSWYDFTQASSYVIPYSDLQNIIVYSEASSFDGVNPWGTGLKPIFYDSSYVTYDTATASVVVSAYTNGDQASAVANIELSEVGIPEVFTVYGVCACDLSATTFGYIVSLFGRNYRGSCPMVACDGRNNLYRLQCGSYYQDRNTDYVSMKGKFFACALKINKQAGTLKAFINDYVSDDIPISTTEIYRYIVLASSQGQRQNTDSRYKFIGCVNGLETDTVVANNISNLRFIYGI